MSVIENVIKNPKLALKNATNRFINGINTDSGSSTNTSLLSGVKDFFTPQSVYASEGDPGMIQSGNYSLKAKFNADGSIGYDYFLNGQPITETDYANAGMDVQKDNGLAQADLIKNSKATIAPDPINPNGKGGTSIQSRQVVGPDGGIYDLNTPAGAEAYKVAKDNFVNTEYTNKINEFNTSLARGKEDLAKQKTAYQTSKDRFYGANGQMGTYDKGIKDLNQTKDQRDAGTIGYFLNKGANVYQSAEGDAMKESGNIYNEGLQSANQQKQDTETNFNTFDTQIQRAAADLAKQEIDTPKYYDNWKAQNLAQDTVDKTAATQNIANFYKSNPTPTFQDKAFDLSNYYAKLSANPYLSDSMKSGMLTKAGQSAGVNIGQDTYNIYKQLDSAVQNNDTNKIDELNKKLYGTSY